MVSNLESDNLENGKVWAFGKGAHGRLGIGTDINCEEPMMLESLSKVFISKISSGCRHAAAVTDTGELYTWGQF